jgi:hypothetical protein
MTAKPLATFTDNVALVLHGVGAAFCFVGYFACEMYAVCWYNAHERSNDAERLLKKERNERRWRVLTCIVFILSFAIFGVCYALDKVNVNGKYMDCGDKWVEIAQNVTFYVDGTLNQKQETFNKLFDTAKGWCLAIKVLGYCGEILAFVCMLVNMWIIWFYCEERQSSVSSGYLLRIDHDDMSEEEKEDEDEEYQ